MTQAQISSTARRPREHGSALIVVMIILIIVSILGVAATQLGLMAERSSRNERDYQLALQSAQAALQDAEFDIQDQGPADRKRGELFQDGSQLGFEPGCATTSKYRGLCKPNAEGSKEVWYTVDFTDTSDTAPTVEFGAYTGRSFASGATGMRPALPPRYHIEVLSDAEPGAAANEIGSGGTTPPLYLYRITAMGFGPNVNTTAVLQKVYRKK